MFLLNYHHLCLMALWSLQGGFLEAQTALTQQAHRHRRAHLRQAREQRRHKVVYTVNGTAASYYLNKQSSFKICLNVVLLFDSNIMWSACLAL